LAYWRAWKNIGLGSTTGYVFTYQEIDHDVSISKITNEAANDLPATADKNLAVDKRWI